MKYSQARPGRVFVIRLEDGDVLHEGIERFAREQQVRAGWLVLVGGADRDSTIVVGPERARSVPVVPMEHVLENVHEIAAVGTLFPDEQGQTTLHMHAAFGRCESALVGCVRRGVRVWHVMEAVLYELTDCRAVRRMDAGTGFHLLDPG